MARRGPAMKGQPARVWWGLAVWALVLVFGVGMGLLALALLGRGT